VTVPEADVPAEGALVLPEERCAVVRSGGRLMAFDLTCPHLGCTVKATEQGFACPCHGSRFGTDGRVQDGPADRPLARRAVERRDGAVVVSREPGADTEAGG
jgi:Rieske Fe-S protein